MKCFIFDLDGTLVYTLGDIAETMNGFLESRGWPAHPVEAYRMMVGRGLTNLIRAAVPPEHAGSAEKLYPAVFTLFEARGVGSSSPYPGAADALSLLAKAGASLAVVSNKPDPFTTAMVKSLFPDVPFRFVHGDRDGVPSKPDPASALEAARACGVAPTDCAFVGDSDVDMKTAVAAGMVPVGAAWGFRGEAELRAAGAMIIARSISEIPSLLS
ncbi:MAG: hypothetical protein CVV51_04950 [Spirochaetae bacterium HGW-Spirochaetae-7]|nr:MAG: hypothetical protein CVV51_04950 [Spirochaetae bacterium HGW-Spirochaetae-7]